MQTETRHNVFDSLITNGGKWAEWYVTQSECIMERFESNQIITLSLLWVMVMITSMLPQYLRRRRGAPRFEGWNIHKIHMYCVFSLYKWVRLLADVSCCGIVVTWSSSSSWSSSSWWWCKDESDLPRKLSFSGSEEENLRCIVKLSCVRNRWMIGKDSLRAGFWFQQLVISCRNESEQLILCSVSHSPDPTLQIRDSTDNLSNGNLYADISYRSVPKAYTSDSMV